MVETISHTKLVAEEVELLICPMCDQEYEELIPIWIGEYEHPDDRVENRAAMCEGCAEATFGYTEDAEPITWEDIQQSYYPFRHTTSLSYLLIVSVLFSTVVAGVSMMITGTVLEWSSIEHRVTAASVWAIALYVLFIHPARKSVCAS